MKPGVTQMQDWRGVEVKVGDIVVYPVRQSSSLWMVEGEVVELHSMIEDRWQVGYNEPGRMVPTQVGGVTVKRLRESFSTGDKEVKSKHVKVGLDRLTVVATAEAVEMSRYPIRYVVGLDPDAALVTTGPGQIWELPSSNIEIDPHGGT